MKLRYDLIPVAPLRELARAYTVGAEKYSDRDWQTRYASGQVVGKLMRHLEAWRGGEDKSEDGVYHLAAVAFHAFTLLWLSLYRPSADDRAERNGNQNVGFAMGGTGLLNCEKITPLERLKAAASIR